MNDEVRATQDQDDTKLAEMRSMSSSPSFGERLKAANQIWPHLKPRWHPHLPDRERPIAEAPPREDRRMTAEEDYGFDVKGFLVIRGVLSPEELAACNQLVDAGEVPEGLSSHRGIIPYLEELCGLAYRVDVPATMLATLEAGEKQRLSGGNEPRNPSRAYFHQGTSRFCQGIRAVWALADVPAGAGGLVLLPGSHTNEVPVPECVRNGEDDYLESIGMCLQPVLKAGDLLLHAATLAQGLKPWTSSEGPQRLVACEFVSVYARPSDPALDSLSAAGTVPEPPWAQGMSREQQTVLGLLDTSDGPASPLISDGSTLHTDTSFRQQDGPYHPGVHTNQLSDPSTVDPLEFFYWDLTGFLIVRNVMDADWLRECNHVFEENRHRINYEGARKTEVGGSVMMRGTGRPNLAIGELSAEDRDPFERMLAHPALVHRLNWMLGGHFRCDGLGSVIATQRGGGGQILHGNGDPIYPFLNWWPYLYQNGRSYTGQVNVAWQLHDVSETEGGFVVVPGSHHARYPLPSNDPGDPAAHKGVMHPLMRAGDLLFFMGGATTHGSIAWHSDLERRCLLNAYWSKDMARFAWVNASE